jgi:deoxyribodipyrimidine photo-lyase
LLWRDYFRLIAKKYGDKIFVSNGISEEEAPEWSTDRTLFNIWAQARTGVPMIDANMRELNTTGFMSNRGRQNVASFLVNDMKVHWLLGAEYFESMLIDYDPCSNYGNWNYIAGVGVDPRPGRWFNVVHQGKRYDSKGEHAHHWLPELDVISGSKVHDLPIMSKADMEEYNIILGKDYPKAVVTDRRWG